MKIVCCANGHFYDADLGKTCPCCGQAGLRHDRALPAAVERLVDGGGFTWVKCGAESDVYRLGRKGDRALKLIDFGRVPDGPARAAHELKIMRRLRGVRGAMQLLDGGVESPGPGGAPGFGWLVMPWCTPLRELLDREQTSYATLAWIALGACKALAACRSAGVAHLDVHPGNIYLDDVGAVLLGDFDVSLFLEELADSRVVRGTPGYVAPEVLRDGRCSERSDIYSLGLLLYGLFNGRRLPFMELYDRDEAIQMRLSGEPFPDVRCDNPTLKAQVMQIVRAACDPDPEKRYPDFGHMGTALDQLCRIARGFGNAGPRPSALMTGDLPEPRASARRGAEKGRRMASRRGIPIIGPLLDRLSHKREKPSQAFADSMEAPRAASAGPGPGSAFDWYRAAGSQGVQQAMERISDEERTMPVAPPRAEGMPVPPLADAEPGTAAQARPMPPEDRSPNDEIWFDSDSVARTFAGPEAQGVGVHRRDTPEPGPVREASGPSLRAAPDAGIDDAPALRRDSVEFTAVAPKTFVRGEYSIVDIVMYERAFRGVVDDMLRQADEPMQEKPIGVRQLAGNDEVRIVLSSQDVEIEEDEQTARWQGGYVDFSFPVLLPEDFRRQQLLFRARVYINGMQQLQLAFTARCSSAREQKLEVFRRNVLSAFVSYASPDRARVTSMIQGMKKICPDMDLFFDVENLRSGQDWEKRIHEEIDRRDILYLCWSRNARKSEYVDMEWRYALRQKGEEGIDPMPIESADICPPPPELNNKHFNDKLLYIIEHEAWKASEGK